MCLCVTTVHFVCVCLVVQRVSFFNEFFFFFLVHCCCYTLSLLAFPPLWRLINPDSSSLHATNSTTEMSETLSWIVGLRNSAGKYLTAETFNFALNCNGSVLKKKQTFTIEAVDGGVLLKRLVCWCGCVICQCVFYVFVCNDQLYP